MSENKNQNTTYTEVKNLFRKYSDIPLEAIIKQDVLRLGMRFSEDSCRIASGYKPKDYFIFSFDLATLDELEEKGEHFLNAPEEIRFSGGPDSLKPTVISVRLNPESPYSIQVLDGKLSLCCEDELIAGVEFHPMPEYYSETLSSGKAISEIAPVLEWGYLIYLTIFRLCQYWGKEEECQYCDINENYRQQKKAGREYTGIKDVADILDALDTIYRKDQTAKAITITGGSITRLLSGKNEADFYRDYAAAVHERFGDHWILKAGVEAYPIEDCKRLAEAGIKIYHPNFEIWDETLFKRICPGKERFVGRDEWVKRTVDAAEVFGPQNVIPNFVAGVEMAQPFGYQNFQEAVESTRQGLEYFMSRSIMPRFTTWCREPLAHLKNQDSPPLEYYVKLLLVWRDTFEKYQLPSPPGYGKPGAGNAVFSVSAFMDVIRED